jgi:hypothetical protein
MATAVLSWTFLGGVGKLALFIQEFGDGHRRPA